MDNWASILPLALLVLAFILLVVRPARRRQREFQSLQVALAPGQRVMIASGIFGEIVAIGDETIELQIADNTVITVNRHAVSRVIPSETESEPGEDR